MLNAINTTSIYCIFNMAMFFDLKGSSSGQWYNMHKCIYLIHLKTFILYNMTDIVTCIFKQICMTEISIPNTITIVQVFPFMYCTSTGLKKILWCYPIKDTNKY